MSIVNEEWRDCVGYEGLYQVSNLGRVKSLQRCVLHSRGGQKIIRERILKQGTDRGRYRYIAFCVDAKLKTFRVHELVAKAFLGDRPNGYDINHIDGDKDNNCLDNLEYCTRLRNLCHALEMGLRIPVKGEKHSKAKLTEHQVLEIRRLFAQGGISKAAIARMYGVSSSLIFDVVSNKRWTHVKDPYENNCETPA